MRQIPADFAAWPSLRAGGVARHVVSVLSSELRILYPDTPPQVLVRFLDQFYAALLAADMAAVAQVLCMMRRSGIRDVDIADYYIPVIARRAGEEWLSDSLDFSDVSLAMLRLQQTLYGLDPSWQSPEQWPFGTLGEILVFSPQDMQHTLGANILAGQIRRAGYGVTLRTGLRTDEIAQMVRNSTYVAVMISTTGQLALDFLGLIVKQVRQGNADVPVIIGGHVLETEYDVAEATGADLATSDWATALTFCEKRA